MKRDLKKVLRSGMSLLLVFCMVIGFFPASVFAVDGTETLNYVSLGDSMVNGYGLDGYEYEYHCDTHSDYYGCKNAGCQNIYNECSDPDCTENHIVWHWGNGYLQEAPESYPAMLAEYFGWELTQMAVSAMRVEDLHWVLEYDGNDAAQYAAANMSSWDEATWNAAFTNGDYFTWDRFSTGRFENHVYPNSTPEKVADTYQSAVADADVISLGIGNGNFGVYALELIMQCVGFSDNDEIGYYSVESAIRNLDADSQAQILDLMDALYEQFAALGLDASDPETAELLDVMTYVAVSYVINYRGTIDAIIEMNPDAEIIIVGLMNTMDGMLFDLGYEEPVDFGELMGTTLSVVNAYMTTLPTVLQAAGEYPDATFYYAEADNVDVMVNNYADVIGDSETVRNRFLTEIVGESDGDWGMVWELLIGLTKATETPDDDNYVYITEEEVKAYEEMETGEKLYYANVNAKKAQSIAVYLAFEDAVLAACDPDDGVEPVLSLEALLNLGNLGGIFDGVFAEYEENVTIAIANDPTLGAVYATYGNSAATLLATPEALSSALQGDETVFGLLNLFARCLIGDGLGAHPSAAGHETLYEAIKTTYETGYTAQDETIANLTAAAEVMAALAAEYYDEAYAYAYSYAAENGYVDAAVASIDSVIGALTAIDLSGTEMTDEFKAEVAGEIEEIIETLKAAQNLITEADVLDEATLNALVATLDEAGEATENLLNVLEQAGVDTLELAVIPAAEAAYETLVNEVIPAVVADLTEAVAAGTAWLMEQAQAAYDELVEATVAAAKKYAPEVADWIYNWLYNNPDKVIAFFNEYGDDAAAFLNEYSEEILAVLGYLVVTYGDEVAEYVMDNADEILTTMVEWFEVHGENTWALIEVYLNELGIIDAIEENIAAATAAIEALLAQLDEAIYGELTAMLEELLAVVEELAAQAEALGVDITAELEELDAALGELQAALETLVAEGTEAALEALEKAAEEIDAAINDILTALGDKVTAEIEALVAEVEALVEEINTAINDLINFVNEVQTGIDNALTELGTLLDQMGEEVYGELAATVEELLEKIETLIAEAEKVGAAVQDELEALYAAVEKLQDAVETLVNEGAAAANVKLQEAVAEIATAVENLVAAMSEDAAEAVAGVVADINALLNDLYLDATTAEYEVTADSYYVAIGDGSAVSESYVDLLAEELGVDYKNLAEEGQMIQDAGTVIAANAAEIAKADLITVGYSNTTFVNNAIDQVLYGAEELDWSAIVTEEGVQFVEQALAELEAQITEAGIEGTVMGLDTKATVMTVIEAYAYAAAAYAVSMPEVVNAIHEINPEALVIVVGMYNPLAGVSIDLGDGNVLDVGEYLDYLVAGVTVHGIAYSMISGNAIFVEAPAVETINTDTELDLTDLIVMFIREAGASLNPSEAGQEYIKTQILEALTIKRNGLLGDADSNGVVNNIDAMFVLQYSIDIIDETGLDLSVCDVNGDGVVTNVDAMFILQYSIDLIEKFPVE